jgi:hypothetical protein
MKKANLTFIQTSKKMNLMTTTLQIMEIISLIVTWADLKRMWKGWGVMVPIFMVLNVGTIEVQWFGFT